MEEPCGIPRLLDPLLRLRLHFLRSTLLGRAFILQNALVRALHLGFLRFLFLSFPGPLAPSLSAGMKLFLLRRFLRTAFRLGFPLRLRLLFFAFAFLLLAFPRDLTSKSTLHQVRPALGFRLALPTCLRGALCLPLHNRLPLLFLAVALFDLIFPCLLPLQVTSPCAFVRFELLLFRIPLFHLLDFRLGGAFLRLTLSEFLLLALEVAMILEFHP